MIERYSGDFHLGHCNIMKYCGRTQFMTKEEVIEYEKTKILVEVAKAEGDSGKERMLWFKLHISKESLDRMNETLIRNWNERVKPGDLTYMNGDFCFRSAGTKTKGEGELIPATYWESRLNGKIIFIKGSHDKQNSCKTNIEGILIRRAKEQIYIVHDPRHINYNYIINLTGHVHGLWKFAQFNVNREVDRWGAPIMDTEIVDPIAGQIVHAANVGVDVNNFRPVDMEEIMKEYWKWRSGVVDYQGKKK